MCFCVLCDVQKPLSTLDEVSIYQRDIVPMGSPMTRLRIIIVITTWDASDGIPLTIQRYDDPAKWHKLSADSTPFTLYCLPGTYLVCVCVLFRHSFFNVLSLFVRDCLQCLWRNMTSNTLPRKVLAKLDMLAPYLRVCIARLRSSDSASTACLTLIKIHS